VLLLSIVTMSLRDLANAMKALRMTVLLLSIVTMSLRDLANAMKALRMTVLLPSIVTLSAAKGLSRWANFHLHFLTDWAILQWYKRHIPSGDDEEE